MSEHDRPAPRAGFASDVAGDMAAIFGDDLRTDRTVAPPAVAPAMAGASRRRRPVMAVALAGVALSIAAGAVIGRSAFDNPGGTANMRADAAAARSRAAAVARPQAAPSPLVAPVSLPPVAPADTVAEAAVAAPARAVAGRYAAVRAPVAAALPGRPVVAEATDMGGAPPAMPAAAGRRCFDAIDCTNVRLYAAEGEVADAYAVASSAGVRARLLRGYRDEWVRTRRLAAGQPGEALRRYGMIAADLNDLADDAAEPPRTWQ
jgi:hypothetical protein